MKMANVETHFNSNESLRDATEAMREFRAGRASFDELIIALISPHNSDRDLPDHDLPNRD
jgi:hypothetical protein